MGIVVALGHAASAGLSGCGATTSSMPTAETAPQASALPHTEGDLRHIDNVHVSIIRRASRQCDLEGMSVTPGNEFELPCLTVAVDRAVADSGDSALQAYHDALPRRERYDPRRSDNVWREMIEDDGDE
jgi:hypothetical protein